MIESHVSMSFQLEQEVPSWNESWLQMQKIEYRFQTATIAGWGCDVDEDESVTFNQSCVSTILRTVDLIMPTAKVCEKVFPTASFKLYETCAYVPISKKISLVIKYKNSTKYVLKDLLTILPSKTMITKVFSYLLYRETLVVLWLKLL